MRQSCFLRFEWCSSCLWVARGRAWACVGVQCLFRYVCLCLCVCVCVLACGCTCFPCDCVRVWVRVRVLAFACVCSHYFNTDINTDSFFFFFFFVRISKEWLSVRECFLWCRFKAFSTWRKLIDIYISILNFNLAHWTKVDRVTEKKMLIVGHCWNNICL